MIIYQITNNVNGNFYIGQTTKSVKERLQKHFYNARYGNKTYLYSAIRKYGEESFSISILEETTDLNIREMFWIHKLNPKYNMTLGGEGGNTSQSPNFKRSMQEYHSKKTSDDYATYGMMYKHHTAESKMKISKSNSCPVMCEKIRYESVGDAEKAYPGIKLRARLDNSRYPDFFRLKPKISR